MKVIEQHIDYMFRDLPETEEIKRIKNDLYLNGLDRFEELSNQGRTESEALGTIIVEMGELDVLLDEIGYDVERDLEDYSMNSLEEAESYVHFNRKESNKIAFGVFLILVGAGLIPTLETFNAGGVGVVLLMLFIAIAVGTFIMSGMKQENIGKHVSDDDQVYYMADDDYDQLETQYLMFKEKESYRIPVGVMLTILAAIPIIIFSFMENEFLIERYGILLLMIMIGIGVSQFIKYGMVNTAFEKALNIGEYSEEERRLQKKMEPIAGIYWISMTLIYLTWSFLTMNWHITWMVWPAAGFIWAIVSIVLENSVKRDNE